MIIPRSLHGAHVAILCLLMTISIGSSARTSEIKGCVDKEKQALLRFKQGLVDESNVLSSWGSKKDCCQWRGITCNDKTGRVVALDLSHNISDVFSVEQPLGGEITPSLLELRDLNYLDLSLNNFGELKIPNFIGSFGQLKHLKLASVGFVGTIPRKIENLTGLHTLDLSRNLDLVVDNLDWLSSLSSLRYLNLSRLNLSEVVNWPQSVSKLPYLLELQLSSCSLTNVSPNSFLLDNSSNSLQLLDLSDNHFGPSIFYWVSNISSSLVHIGLSGCQMRGPIPDVFTNIVSLVSLDLSYNQLEGGLPKSFRNLCSLESLNLRENSLSDRIYDSVKNLSCAEQTLKHLLLSGNPFWGPFPDISRFISLVELYVDHTNMSGPLPKNLSQFSKLDTLSLVSNKLNGSLPDFTGLSSLRMLFLSNNQLSGSVPKSLGKLSGLEILLLSSNSLDAVLTEAQFSNLSSLQSLDISYNPLSLNISSDWIPPFQLDSLVMISCKVGPAFPKWILSQRKLRSLHMPYAGISDSIPEGFWDISTSLTELNLSSNQIYGKLPNLSSTNYTFFSFDLSSNLLDGPIPLIPPSLSMLILSKNRFSGSISSLCESKSPSLSHIDLSNNLLSGELPDCWIQFQGLLFLNLAKNDFSGKMPSSLSNLTNVMLLRLHENNFSGELPSLEGCKELRVVDLGGNMLSGSIPGTWAGQNLPNLLVLRLRHNDLRGSLPLSLCSLPALHVLDFSHNNISGALPKCLSNITAMSYEVTDNIILGFVQVAWKGIEIEFGQNLKHLRSVDISSNSLSGVIPENITGLLKLVSLNLSRNSLIGGIPGDFDKLSYLESLDLSRNRLLGGIPTSFSILNFLSYLDLSYNNLSGRIPLGTQLQTFNASSFTGNLQLCGPPLTKYCPGDDVNEDVGAGNGSGSDENEEEDDEYITFGFGVSIGIGFFVGFWGVCGSLLVKSSWREAYFRFFDYTKERIFKRARALFKPRLQRRH